MAKYASFGKRENEKKKQARRVEKQNRKEERKSSGKATSFEDMIAYVDENGMITSVPPELRQKEEINQEDILISTPKKEDVAPVILRGRVDYFNCPKASIFSSLVAILFTYSIMIVKERGQGRTRPSVCFIVVLS